MTALDDLDVQQPGKPEFHAHRKDTELQSAGARPLFKSVVPQHAPANRSTARTLCAEATSAFGGSDDSHKAVAVGMGPPSLELVSD